MKKSLLALATMGAFAGAAHAQSSVTVSGALEVGYTSKDIREISSTTTNTKQSSFTSGHVITPNITFSGTEDLGGGLSAGFFIQEEFDTATGTVDTSGSSLKLSQTFITLGSKQFGSINLGNKNHVTRDAGGVYRFFGDIGRLPGVFNKTNNFANTVEYVSPRISGFAISAGYGSANKTLSTGTSAGTHTNITPASLTTFGINGTVGKGTIAATHETNAVAATAAGLEQAQLTQITVAGNYDFGMAKVGLVYADQAFKQAGGADGGKRTAMGVHLAAPVTKAITLGASFTSINVKPAAGGDEPKADIFTVAAQYAFSKRTSVYGSYQMLRNNGTANALADVAANATSINGATAAGSTRGLGVVETTGATANGIGLTMVHTF
jgi:predicted porin